MIGSTCRLDNTNGRLTCQRAYKQLSPWKQQRYLQYFQATHSAKYTLAAIHSQGQENVLVWYAHLCSNSSLDTAHTQLRQQGRLTTRDSPWWSGTTPLVSVAELAAIMSSLPQCQRGCFQLDWLYPRRDVALDVRPSSSFDPTDSVLTARQHRA
jgi:hypothetical protein